MEIKSDLPVEGKRYIMKFRKCLAGNVFRFIGTALVAVLFGGLVLLIGSAALSCLLSRSALLTCMAIVLKFTLPIFLSVIGAYAAVLLIIAIGYCLITTAKTGGDIDEDNPSLIAGALTDKSPVDCARAKELLALAQHALEAAQTVLGNQAQIVENVQRRLSWAVVALAGVAAAVVAAVFQPGLLFGVLAALAIATALFASRTPAYIREKAKIRPLQTDVLLCYADVAAAEALVSSLCPSEETDLSDGVLSAGYTLDLLGGL